DLMDEAANEIDRLRGYRDIAEADRDVAMLAAERLRLTDDERHAIDVAATAVMLEDNNISTVLWELLKRTK
ncbi:MAG: hypothetical protein EBR82_82735, partial [Caulobacteraceae bacterium]|nr:hypothetical protein [Caulobacteraceae bacterium]